VILLEFEKNVERRQPRELRPLDWHPADGRFDAPIAQLAAVKDLAS